MSSREAILNAVKRNQPALHPLPELVNYKQAFDNPVLKFIDVAKAVGASVYEVEDYSQSDALLAELFAGSARILTVDKSLSTLAQEYESGKDARLLENVDVALISVHFAVAENGAVFISEALIKERVIPFICQHLVAFVKKSAIVPSMHDAYARIGTDDYGFATFIAGPSKTADIEQSLVLGAHGPRTMTLFLVNE